MLKPEEKAKVKDILGDGLGINRNINLAYFLDLIEENSQTTKEIKTQIAMILNNQKVLDKKLDRIIELIAGH
jgi:hypothetical protein